MLAEADVESLKVLQTILLLVTTTEIVSGQHLAKVFSLKAFTRNCVYEILCLISISM